MQTQQPMCMGCQHLHQGFVLTCDAFPARIPDDILDSRVDHRQPVKGDHGIQFAPTSDAAAAYAASLFEEEPTMSQPSPQSGVGAVHRPKPLGATNQVKLPPAPKPKPKPAKKRGK